VRKEEKMAEGEVLHEVVLDQLRDGVYFVDRQKRITYWNQGAERITGYSRAEVLGKVFDDDLLGHVDKKGLAMFSGRCPLELCIKNGACYEKELYLKHKDGHQIPVFSRISPILNSLGEIIAALEVFSDDSSRVQAMERIEELEEMALLCPLTEVGNRRYATMALENAIEELKRYQWDFGLLFVDIDNFKDINDHHGHNVGDEVLRMVAHALRASLRAFDFVGRWGGEEFLVLLPNITDELLVSIAERCRYLIEEAAFQHDGKEYHVTVSIGATLAVPEDSVESCVERVDALMYQSKASGRNRVTLDI
jgi:diguanylate cyclase (GGDEF)-like protein/PAS domain S-box-containing protein